MIASNSNLLLVQSFLGGIFVYHMLHIVRKVHQLMLLFKFIFQYCVIYIKLSYYIRSIATSVNTWISCTIQCPCELWFENLKKKMNCHNVEWVYLLGYHLVAVGKNWHTRSNPKPEKLWRPLNLKNPNLTWPYLEKKLPLNILYIFGFQICVQFFFKCPYLINFI